jgi:hypothetical protein
LECIFGNTANVVLWNFWLHKISINKNMAMSNKNNSLQVGKTWKFAPTKTNEM